MNFTLGYLTVAPASFLEVIAATKFAGFVGCGMRITGRTMADGLPTLVGDPSTVKDMRRALDDTGVRLNSVAAYNMTPEMKVSDYDPVIEIGAALGVKIFTVLCHDPDEARFIDKFAGFTAAVGKVGGKSSLEFMPYSQAKTIEQAVRMINGAGLPNAALQLDSLHLYRSGGTAQSIKAVDPQRIIHVQLCDARAPVPGMDLVQESRTARRLPGAGELPLFEFMDALPADLQSIECEAPHPPHKHLPVNEQAQLAFQSMENFVKSWRARPQKAA